MLNKLFLMLQSLPNELITVIVAALPVSELRGAIPLALFSLKEPFWKVFFLAILGNLLPVIPLLLFLKPVSEKLRHFKLWEKFFDRLFEHARKKASLVERYEALGLALFVAIPLPVTGAWTGCIAASLFKIRLRYAFLAICAGVTIAAIIVSATSIVGRGIFFHLFLAQ
ncbi:MAG: small multi-drug export protein [Candidatus Omnitrophica bacterium]|nr:small multi-drug export protein [Candidatus Omnitrophota bacterium]